MRKSRWSRTTRGPCLIQDPSARQLKQLWLLRGIRRHHPMEAQFDVARAIRVHHKADLRQDCPWRRLEGVDPKRSLADGAALAPR